MICKSFCTHCMYEKSLNVVEDLLLNQTYWNNLNTHFPLFGLSYYHVLYFCDLLNLSCFATSFHIQSTLGDLISHAFPWNFHTWVPGILYNLGGPHPNLNHQAFCSATIHLVLQWLGGHTQSLKPPKYLKRPHDGLLYKMGGGTPMALRKGDLHSWRPAGSRSSLSASHG